MKYNNYKNLVLVNYIEEEPVQRSYSMPGGLIVLLIFMLVITLVIIHMKSN